MTRDRSWVPRELPRWQRPGRQSQPVAARRSFEYSCSWDDEVGRVGIAPEQVPELRVLVTRGGTLDGNQTTTTMVDVRDGDSRVPHPAGYADERGKLCNVDSPGFDRDVGAVPFVAVLVSYGVAPGVVQDVVGAPVGEVDSDPFAECFYAECELVQDDFVEGALASLAEFLRHDGSCHFESTTQMNPSVRFQYRS